VLQPSTSIRATSQHNQGGGKRRRGPRDRRFE
jgi:hypothetical protein